MEVKIREQTILLKSLSYLDYMELSELKSRREHATQVFILSGITKDIVNTLTLEEGKYLMEKINELNGFTDFQNPSSDVKSS